MLDPVLDGGLESEAAQAGQQSDAEQNQGAVDEHSDEDEAHQNQIREKFDVSDQKGRSEMGWINVDLGQDLASFLAVQLMK